MWIGMLLVLWKVDARWEREKGPGLCWYRICEDEMEIRRVLQSLQYQVDRMNGNQER